MLAEEISLEPTDPKRQPHFALRFVNSKQRLGFKLRESDTEAIKRATHDPNGGVRAAALLCLVLAGTESATDLVMRELETMEPDRMNGGNLGFTSLMAALADELRTIPNGVSYERLARLRSRISESADEIRIYSDANHMRMPVREVSASLAVNPVIEAMRRKNQAETLAAIKGLASRVRSVGNVYGSVIPEKQRTEFIASLRQADPLVRKTFLDVTTNVSNSDFQAEVLIGVLESEMPKPQGQDRLVEQTLKAVRTLSFQGSTVSESVKAKLLHICQTASHDPDEQVRIASYGALAALRDGRALRTFDERLTSLPAPNGELLALLPAYENLANSVPDSLDPPRLRGLLERLPGTLVAAPDFQTALYGDPNTALSSLRARVGQTPPPSVPPAPSP